MDSGINLDTMEMNGTVNGETNVPNRKKVYLDYNSKTPLAPEVKAAMNDVFDNAWASPSSPYESGQIARKYITKARTSVARMMNATSPDEILFTSGSTEANNVVFHSIIHYFKMNNFGRPHVIISAVERDSVSLTARRLEQAGKMELTVIPVVRKDTVNSNRKSFVRFGYVDPDEVARNILPHTALVSVVLANNETGVVNPIRRIVEVVRAKKLTPPQCNQPHDIFVHTDASMGFGKIPVDVQALGVDYLTFGGHKFYGPVNGAVYIRGGVLGDDTPLATILFGASQEKGFRPGTENTPQIVGLGTACDLVSSNLTTYSKQMADKTIYLASKLKDEFGSAVVINFVDEENMKSFLRNDSFVLPNTLSVGFRWKRSLVSSIGDENDDNDDDGGPLSPTAPRFLQNTMKPIPTNFLLGMNVISNLRNLEIGSPSAGHTVRARDISKKVSVERVIPSSTLLACGISQTLTQATVRLSVGRETTDADIDLAVQELRSAFDKEIKRLS